MEDPSFTIRQMVVSVAWPGATASQMEEQVTDKIEKKLQDTPGLDYVKSFSRSGEAVIYVNLRDDIDNDKIRPTWLEVRNMVDDIKKGFTRRRFMGHIIMTDLMMYMVLYMLSQVMVILMKKCVKRQKNKTYLIDCG